MARTINSIQIGIMRDYERTLKNCEFYEREGKTVCLNNEIGVLRGLMYSMETILGYIPMNDDRTNHFIEVQNELCNRSERFQNWR